MDIFRGWGVEIVLNKRADFLVVKETLTRIGIAQQDKKLWQCCHILHKQGRYAIIHFLELNAMDGRYVTVELADIALRNKTVALLEEWGLVKVLDPQKIVEQIPINQMKILNYKEKAEWSLEPRYHFLQRKKDT